MNTQNRTNTKGFLVWLKPETHHEFKKLAVEHRSAMSAVIQQYIDDLVSGKKKMPSNLDGRMNNKGPRKS